MSDTKNYTISYKAKKSKKINSVVIEASSLHDAITQFLVLYPNYEFNSILEENEKPKVIPKKKGRCLVCEWCKGFIALGDCSTLISYDENNPPEYYEDLKPYHYKCLELYKESLKE